MITVLYVLPHPPRQSETFVSNEIRTVMRRDDVRVLVVYARPDGRRFPRLSRYHLSNALSLREFYPDFAYDIACRFAARNLARALEGIEFNLVHAHFASFPARVAIHLARDRGVPVTVTAHAADYLLQPANRLRDTLRNANHVFAISRDAARHLGELGSLSSQVSVVRAAVDPDMEILERPTVGKAHRTVRFLTVARLVEKKGVDQCLHLADELRDIGLDFSWDVVGDGPLREELLKLRDELGLQAHVTFWGAQTHDTVVSLLGRASIAVLTCRTSSSGDEDGIPVFLLECAASGLPFVTTNVGGIGDLVQDASLACISATDIVAAAHRIGYLLRNEEERIGLTKTLRERFLAEFHPSLQVDRYLESWHSLSTYTEVQKSDLDHDS